MTSSPPGRKPSYWKRNAEQPHSSLDNSLGIAVLVLLAVFIVSVFVVPKQVESNVREAVEKVLRRSGMAHLDVTTNGQNVVVSGQVAADDIKASIARLHAIARGATCQVAVIGELICPTKVAVSIEQMATGSATSAGASVIPRTSPLKVGQDGSTHDFTLSKSTDFLTIAGAMPSAKIRDLMLKQATQAGLAVIDDMQITNRNPTQYYPWAIERAWEIIEYLEYGEIAWLDGRFSVSGQITSEDEAQINAAYHSALFRDQLAGLKLEVRPVYNEVSTCNQAVAEVLEHDTLDFAPQSARILSNSEPLLDQLAVLVEQCTLPFSVENHVEASAQPENDLSLSQARAEAVVMALIERGVEAHRLSAHGYGGTRQQKNNNTPIARMQNRRTDVIAKAH